MKFNKFSTLILLIGILIAACFAFYVRAFLPYDQVFTPLGIKFTSNDAYFQMRLVDGLVHNFPHLNNFDPYLIFPAGSTIDRTHFFNYLLAGIIWLMGFGSPSQHLIDVVGAYFPAVLGALIVIPAYFIGKALFNRWAGLLAAALIAILPGEFLGRSILGFTDHHVAETLFSAVTMLFLILAIKTASERQVTFNLLKLSNRATLTRPLVFSLLAGISLGIYLITWGGGLLFVFIVSVYLVIQAIIDHLRHKSSDYLGISGAIFFLVALIIVLPVSLNTFNLYSLLIAILIPLVLAGISRLMTGRQLKPAYYPLAIIVAGLAGLGIFYLLSPNILGLMLGKFDLFFPEGASRTTLEMQPILYPQGEFTTAIAWGNFTTSSFLISPTAANPWWFPGLIFIPLLLLILLFKKLGEFHVTHWFWVIWIALFLAIVGVWFIREPSWKYWFPGFSIITLLILIYLAIRRGPPERNLFIIWSLIILAAVLAQRRFAYYFVVNVAVLTGYLSWQFLRFVALLADRSSGRIGSADFRTGLFHPEKTIPTSVPRKAPPKIKQNDLYMTKNIFITLGIIIVFFFAFFFNIKPTIAVAQSAKFAPSDAWQSSLLWLRDNTPAPFTDPDFYYQTYERPPAGQPYQYPASAYGVTSWWDYGYWITRVAHRLPTSNPGQTPGPIIKTANFFLSQEESTAREIMQEFGTSYVIIDNEMATTKFWAMVTWAGGNESDYMDVYYAPVQNKLMPAVLYSPEYYRTLCARLYNFDGKAVTAERPVVISYEDKISSDGTPYKELASAREFASYEEALKYVESQSSGKYRIVGASPFASPVALDAVIDYRLIHSSATGATQKDGTLVPYVKIFEYLK